MLGFLLDGEKVSKLVTRLPLLQTTVRWMQGLLFVSLWYGSICAGLLFLYCPLLPLLLFHQRLFRQLTDIVFATWEIYPTALLECVLGIRIVVTGDPVLSHEHSLLIMNHRTRTDWNFLWAAMFYASRPLAHHLKFVLKDPIRHIPGPGWVMQLTCFMFIHRSWEQDKHLLTKTLDYFSDIGQTCQILLFPEGTDLTESSRQRSHEFANTHGLKRYNYVLHPKTTGFVFLVQRMRQNKQLDAVYDLTVGYPYHIPQQETDLLRGNFPQEVHFNIKRFPSSSLPTEEQELRNWLAGIWREKERTLHDFYSCGYFKPLFSVDKTPSPLDMSLQENTLSSDKSHNASNNLNSKTTPCMLPSPDYSELDSIPKSTIIPSSNKTVNLFNTPKSNPVTYNSALYLSLLFWTLLSFLLLVGLLISYTVQLWVIANCCLFATLSVFSEGTHLIEISLYRLKQKYFLGKRHS